MRVLVTGASGFIGRAVCRELSERGHDIAALVRRAGSEPPGTKPVTGDLADEDSISAGIEGGGPDCVIHLAAEIATQRDARRIQEVNVAGTRALLEACERAGVRRFVFASTVVTGDAHGRLLDEESELPVETTYGRSKQEGERMVRTAGLEGVVIRPSHVYGPGGWYVNELIAQLRRPGRLAVIGSGENWWDVVRERDVATAMVDAAERAPAGATYHVVDDRPIPFYEFMSLTASNLGLGPPRRVPVWLARLARGRDPVISTTRSARSSNARIKRELGWSPRFPTAEEGIPDAIAELDGR
jgi:nucleoside-diphosphate-sugar epimerase